MEAGKGCESKAVWALCLFVMRRSLVEAHMLVKSCRETEIIIIIKKTNMAGERERQRRGEQSCLPAA